MTAPDTNAIRAKAKMWHLPAGIADDILALCDAYEYSRLAVAHANDHADTAISDMQELRAEIERLTKERQAFEGMAKDNYDRLQKAEAERDEARAEQAVLLERAAGRMDAGFSYNAGNCVRGVIPDDAQSALESYGLEKVREGMQRAVDLYPQGIAAILADMETLK